MSFQKKSVKGIGLLIAGMVLAVPMVAQQEVDPDHFDSSARTAQNHKAATNQRKLASAHSKHTTVGQVSRTRKSSSEPVSQAAVVVKAEPVTVAAENKPR